MTEEADEKKYGRLSFLVQIEVIDAVEDWRRRQPRIPTIAEASRTLLLAGLAADNKKAKTK